MHILGTHMHIHTEYEVSILNPVARRAVHRRRRQMMPTPDDNYARRTNHDYIGSFCRIPNEPKTTKPVVIQAGTSREIHGLTKIKHGGYTVNCISEPAMGHQLPKGLKLIPDYSPLSPGSCRVAAVVENGTDSDVTIPARTIICYLSARSC